MVTTVPAGPLLGETPVIEGAGAMVKKIALLAVDPTVTTRLPLEALPGTVTRAVMFDHSYTLAATPLKVTVLDPWLTPKSVPVRATTEYGAA